MKGKLIIFSAPSGAGKTTIVKYLLKNIPQLEFSVSACSRPKRKHETHGVDYYFMTVDEFKQKINNNEFVEWEEVYKDNFYGTLKAEIERIHNKGHHIIFDMDVVGGLNLKKNMANKL
jgi:guanylate kinase